MSRYFLYYRSHKLLFPHLYDYWIRGRYVEMTWKYPGVILPIELIDEN